MSSTSPHSKPETPWPQPKLDTATLARLQHLERQSNELRDLLFEVINDNSKIEYRRALIPSVMKLQRKIIAIKRGELVVNGDGSKIDDTNSAGETDDLVTEALYKASDLAGVRPSQKGDEGPLGEKAGGKEDDLWIKIKEPSAAAAGGWVFVD